MASYNWNSCCHSLKQIVPPRLIPKLIKIDKTKRSNKSTNITNEPTNIVYSAMKRCLMKATVVNRCSIQVNYFENRHIKITNKNRGMLKKIYKCLKQFRQSGSK